MLRFDLCAFCSAAGQSVINLIPHQRENCGDQCWSIGLFKAYHRPGRHMPPLELLHTCRGQTTYTRRSLNKIILNNTPALGFLPSGMFPPDADRLHRTSGMGSPPTRHWKTTDRPATTVWFCGPRIRNGFTVEGNGEGVEKREKC